MDIEADLVEVRQPLESSPVTAAVIEQLLARCHAIAPLEIYFEDLGDRLWRLHTPQQDYCVTFFPQVLEEKPSVRLMSFGDPLFEELLHHLADAIAPEHQIV